jgi:hypothetical protein
MMMPATDYRRHAKECLQMASKVADKAAGRWFRLLAAEYLELAAQDAHQIRPAEREPRAK